MLPEHPSVEWRISPPNLRARQINPESNSTPMPWERSHGWSLQLLQALKVLLNVQWGRFGVHYWGSSSKRTCLLLKLTPARTYQPSFSCTLGKNLDLNSHWMLWGLMQPMLEPSFSNSLLPFKVSAFKHGPCTAWTGTSTLRCLSNKGQALRGTSTGKCARLSFIAVLEIAHPSVCTHSTLGRQIPQDI